MPHAADRIRNVALVGHRGSGKTSLHEALLFEAGATTRLGSVADGTTVSDADEDEKSRGMSISASLASFEWRDVKVNLIDTPGEPSFIADALGALRVCESAIFVVNGVMGVEVSTRRLWERAQELRVARLVYVNMLDRERADFFRALDSLKEAFGPHVVATEIPIGSEHELRGLIDLVDMKAYEYDADGDVHGDPDPGRPRRPGAGVPREADGRGRRELRGADGALPRGRGDLPRGDRHTRSRTAPTTATSSRSPAAWPRRRLGANRLLDAIVDDLPSPVQHGGVEVEEGFTLEPDPEGEMFAYVFKTRADPFAGRINLFRVYQGTMTHDTQVHEHAHPSQGARRPAARAARQGGHATPTRSARATSARWPSSRRRTPATGSRRATSRSTCRGSSCPAPVMAFAMEPKNKGDEDKVYTALRRLQEEDPTIDLHRDEQTGEQIVAGLSQIHVEVIVDRMKSRFGAEVTLKPPRVPYQETIRGSAKAHGRHKKQTGGRGQFGDCHIEIEPLADGDFEFVNAIKGGVIPHGFIPAVEKGVLEAMQQGAVAGYPVKGVRVQALRRLLPHGRLVGDGVQARRLASP